MLVIAGDENKPKQEHTGPGLAAPEPMERYVNDDKAELWFVYQQLQVGLRTGNAAKLQGVARLIVDRLGTRFQTRDHNSDKPAQ